MQSANGAAPPPPMAAPVVDHQAQQYTYPYPQQPQPYPMVMYPQGQPQPMWNPQQPYGAAPPQQKPAQPASADEVRTLWIGDLQYWMDDAYLQSCFPSINNEPQVLSIKVIRNRQTTQPEGYGFIEFVSHAVAERVLQTYNGTTMPNGGQKFRLNWASFSAGGRRSDESPDYTIFVGDLAADVTDYTLQETFRAHYSSVKGAKVVIDRLTGHTKGYGFVKFGDESEQVRAMTEMNGVFCSSRPMRIGPANNKKPVGGQQYSNASYQNEHGAQNENDSNNTTIFVGGLDSSVTDEQLRQLFGQYGELVHVKIPVNKGCGFVQFVNRSSAEEALRVLQGTQLGGQNVRLSWGRSPANKQPQQDANQWNGAAAGYYGYTAPGMESYGYAAAPQDPNMYYCGYPAYGNYQQQPQHQVGYS